MYILIIPSWQDEFTRFFIKSFFSCVIFMIKKKYDHQYHNL